MKIDRCDWARSYFLALQAQLLRNPIGFLPPNIKKIAMQLECSDDVARSVMVQLCHEGLAKRVQTSTGRVVYVPITKGVTVQ